MPQRAADRAITAAAFRCSVWGCAGQHLDERLMPPWGSPDVERAKRAPNEGTRLRPSSQAISFAGGGQRTTAVGPAGPDSKPSRAIAGGQRELASVRDLAPVCQRLVYGPAHLQETESIRCLTARTVAHLR